MTQTTVALVAVPATRHGIKVRDTAKTVTLSHTIALEARDTIRKRLTVSVAPQYFTWGAIYLLTTVLRLLTTGGA